MLFTAIGQYFRALPFDQSLTTNGGKRRFKKVIESLHNTTPEPVKWIYIQAFVQRFSAELVGSWLSENQQMLITTWSRCLFSLLWNYRCWPPGNHVCAVNSQFRFSHMLILAVHDHIAFHGCGSTAMSSSFEFVRRHGEQASPAGAALAFFSILDLSPPIIFLEKHDQLHLNPVFF